MKVFARLRRKVGAMDISKIVFVALCVSVSLALSFGAGLYNAAHKTPVYEFCRDIKEHIERSILATWETSVFAPRHFLQPARGPGSGVTINEQPHDRSLILLSGFFEDSNELRLIRRDGSVVRRWPVSYKELLANQNVTHNSPATDWNVDIHGALIEPDGSVVFNFEKYGLVKLDLCGRVLWTLCHPTHHSVELAEDGTYWVPGKRTVREAESAFPPFTTPYQEDLVLNVSRKGEILSEFSVPALLYENRLESVLTAGLRPSGRGTFELVHLNKITVLGTEMAKSFPEFVAGDLILSMRRLNLVLICSPVTRKVKWWQTGPWVRQHDPEFNPDGTLTIFNNNVYCGLDWRSLDGSTTNVSFKTNILRVDPTTRETHIAFGERPGQEMLTSIRGKHELTADGGFLITEFEAGRVIESDADGKIVWEYINRYDEKSIAEVTEARIYPIEYFTMTDWSCSD